MLNTSPARAFFFVNGKTLVVTQVLKWFYVLLAYRKFIKIHRFHLINLASVSSCNNNNQHKIIFKTREQIDIFSRKNTIIK